ncbi:MAG: hypothetical protein HXS40_12255, partial [Theionarchaea archaeon]|nr:hypothetical protein [Theionarchaea archaeon]
MDALDVGAERDAIARELTACGREVPPRIGFATIDELARSLGEEFNILHLSGHGDENFLLSEDGKGGSHPVDDDYLEKLAGMSGPFELAIVSTCHSEKI